MAAEELQQSEMTSIRGRRNEKAAVGADMEVARHSSALNRSSIRVGFDLNLHLQARQIQVAYSSSW